MTTRVIKGLLFWSMILLFQWPYLSSAQCIKKFQSDHSFPVRGISNGYDHYYLNLIIQDLAISSQKEFNEISLYFRYDVDFVVNQCIKDRLEVKVIPFVVSCSPVIYRGYDISQYIRPEKADLVFYIRQKEGFMADSLILENFTLGIDTGLYTTLSYPVKDSATFYNVSFSSARFYFSKSSYEDFRDQILEIDHYFAASLLADSARAWAATGSLAETRNRAELDFRRLELERIAEYINPDRFNELNLNRKNDIADLQGKYNDLVLLSKRYQAIIQYNRFYSDTLDNKVDYPDLLRNLLARLDHHYYLAYNIDFHYVNFIEGLSDPAFIKSFLENYFKVNDSISGRQNADFKPTSKLFIQGFIERGETFENSGNQLRALDYYVAAYRLSASLKDEESMAVTYNLAERMTFAIASSYLDISKRSAMRENPVMAAKYFNEARAVFDENEIIKIEPIWFEEYENWLFLNFEEQASKSISAKNFRAAMDYLKEIQSRCVSTVSYPCPEEFQEWMRQTREGLYLQLLDKALVLVANDEFSEAEQVYSQAIGMRLGGGYRIAKDLKETNLGLTFRQIHYNEFWEEGISNFQRGEYVSSIYYFNKAEFLRREGISHFEEKLYEYRQFAARQVILNQLSDGRVKVWANDFNGAETVIRQVERMISDYQFSREDSVYQQFISLSESLIFKECEIISMDYDKILADADHAAEQGDYILASQQYDKATKLSLQNMKCRVSDEEAWYGKIRLEPLAGYQKMENELELAVYKSIPEYLDLYNGLRKYFNRNKLDKQGLTFEPLINRVLMQKDSAFLAGMLSHYIYLTDYELAFQILKRIHELNFPSDPLKNQQKILAGKLAYLDLKNHPDQEPWTMLNSRTDGDKWYKHFAWNYKISYLKGKKWNIKFWPVIWRK